MEETWMTMQWPNRVFSLLAVTMVYVQNAATYFLNKPKIDSLQSRRLIAEALINNEYLQSGISPRSGHKHHSVDHLLLTVPQFLRLYCSCTPGLMYCTECYANHRADIAGEEKQATKFSGF